jgi:hypothetical protein
LQTPLAYVVSASSEHDGLGGFMQITSLQGSATHAPFAQPKEQVVSVGA